MGARVQLTPSHLRVRLSDALLSHSIHNPPFKTAGRRHQMRAALGPSSKTAASHGRRHWHWIGMLCTSCVLHLPSPSLGAMAKRCRHVVEAGRCKLTRRNTPMAHCTQRETRPNVPYPRIICNKAIQANLAAALAGIRCTRRGTSRPVHTYVHSMQTLVKSLMKLPLVCVPCFMSKTQMGNRGDLGARMGALSVSNAGGDESRGSFTRRND